MEKQTRIVQLRSGKFAVQYYSWAYGNWITQEKFDTQSDAETFQNRIYADEIVKVIR